MHCVHVQDFSIYSQGLLIECTRLYMGRLSAVFLIYEVKFGIILGVEWKYYTCVHTFEGVNTSQAGYNDILCELYWTCHVELIMYNMTCSYLVCEKASWTGNNLHEKVYQDIDTVCGLGLTYLKHCIGI